MTSASLLAGGWLLASRAQLSASPTPSPTGGPDPDSVSPGLTGFLVTFALVAVCLLLFASMVSRLRRLRYRVEHGQVGEPAVQDGKPDRPPGDPDDPAGPGEPDPPGEGGGPDADAADGGGREPGPRTGPS